ncbi:MAG: HD domain-containing protein [Nitrospirae bacterium]|nr:HD domain-containing protein [Nitrospirota bacterium]
MNQADLDFFKGWFSDYCKSFYSSNEADQRNISLKVDHTYNVCKNIKQIFAGSLELEEILNSKLIAETIALFHDIGRFPQYAKYKTFKDNVSVNHGLLGTKTLIQEKILLRLPEKEQNLIIQSIKFHNSFKLPCINDVTIIFFLQLIRDADKLDILRVFIEYYETSQDKRASAAGLGLPDTLEYSKDVLSCFHKGQIPSFTTLKTLCDFKLMKLSWIYDFNFNGSLRILLERDYINRIAAKLPKSEEISNAIQILLEYIHQRLNSVPEKE